MSEVPPGSNVEVWLDDFPGRCHASTEDGYRCQRKVHGGTYAPAHVCQISRYNLMTWGTALSSRLTLDLTVHLHTLHDECPFCHGPGESAEAMTRRLVGEVQWYEGFPSPER